MPPHHHAARTFCLSSSTIALLTIDEGLGPVLRGNSHTLPQQQRSYCTRARLTHMTCTHVFGDDNSYSMDTSIRLENWHVATPGCWLTGIAAAFVVRAQH
jgi:hypothetical protein